MTIFVMFLLFITMIILMIAHERVLIVDYCPSGTDVENCLSERKDFYEIYDYKYFNISNKTIVIYDKDFNKNLVKFNGDLNNRFKECYDYVNKFSYTKNQPNPNKVEEEGGNCQALSLYLKYLLEFNGIYSEMTGDLEHVYLIVDMDNSSYKVDISNKIIEEV